MTAGSIELRNVLAHLVFPERPIVAAFRAPIVNGMANAFAGEDFGEAISGAAVLPWTGTGDQMNVACGQLLVVPADRTGWKGSRRDC